MSTDIPDPAMAIEAGGLVKGYGGTLALDGVDLSVPTGSVTALLGPNGAGKTTTVRVLTTLARADAGWARVAGFDVRRQPREVRSRIGLTAQGATIDRLLTGRENLRLLGHLHQLSRSAARRRADELLASFELEDAADRPTSGYSGGMRRRLDLAATLVGRPTVLFLDEPTTGLDPRARGELWRVIEELVTGGTSVLLTTQYLEEAERLADDILVMNHGHVIAHGDARSLKTTVGGDQVRVVVTQRRDLGQATTIACDALAATAVVDPALLAISLPASQGLDDLLAVSRALSAAGIAVDDARLHQPTLDEVFLQLTGAEPDRDVPMEVA